MTTSIYEQLVSNVSAGLPFSIDFENRSMKVNGLWFIKNGEWDQERPLLPPELENCDAFKKIEELYFEYKHSLPSERIDSKRRKYFKALPIEEIPDSMLWCMVCREEACAALEGFVLCSMLNGTLKWLDEKKWFWQSEVDNDLVLLKCWVENK